MQIQSLYSDLHYIYHIICIQILYYIDEKYAEGCRWISSQLYFIEAGIQKKSKMFQRPTFPCKLIVIRAFIFLYAQVEAQNAKAVTLQLKAES